MSIQRKKNGSWIVRWRYLSQQYSKTFPRKEEAKAFEAEIELAKLKPGALRELTVPGHGVPTFNEFWPLWIEKHAKVFKSAGSAHGDENIIRKHLAPRLGKLKLTEITRSVATDLQAVLSKGRKPRTVNSIVGLLKKMMNDAVYWEVIEENPIAIIRPLKLGQQPFEYWDFDEAAKYLKWAFENDRQLYQLASVILHTGLRRGEAEALSRGDIDFDRRLLTVSKSYDYVTRQVKPPKGRKVRFVPLDDVVLADLAPLKDEPADRRVFELPMMLERYCGKVFNPSCEKAGVTPIGLHGLRHSFASHLAIKGLPVSVIQSVMGHSSVTTTQRYMHLSPDWIEASVRGVDERSFDPRKIGPANAH